MVNENQIPIQKPIEEVKYVDENYQTQSFEEFMKDYKVDENLNYDDLSGGDLGTQKGYGPCGWDNKNCECYLPRFIALYLSCPATGCSNNTPSLWKHTGCGGRMYIEEDAWLKCMKEEGGCGEYGYITDWEFACSVHGGRHWPTRNEDCIEALSAAMKLYANKNSAVKKVVGKIINEIMRRDGSF